MLWDSSTKKEKKSHGLKLTDTFILIFPLRTWQGKGVGRGKENIKKNNKSAGKQLPSATRCPALFPDVHVRS